MDSYKLVVSMVPMGLWGANLRTSLPRRDWDRLRMDHFARFPACEICGATPTGSARHAHEVWNYDARGGVARLARLETLCRMCHFTEHPGFVNVMVAQGRFSPAIREEIETHFCRVNDCSAADYHRHLEDAQIRYNELMRVRAWTVDFGPYGDLAPNLVRRASG